MTNTIELDPTKTYPMKIKNGYLDIRCSQDPEYPGLDIEYISNIENGAPREELYVRPRVLIECPKEDNNLRCLIWGDTGHEDYTDCIDFETPLDK